MDDDLTRVVVAIRGRVQGVFYRDTLRREAYERGVGGYAVNCPDGSVEAAFEGPRGLVEEMIAVARSGPEQARVDSLESREEEPRGESGFAVG